MTITETSEGLGENLPASGSRPSSAKRGLRDGGAVLFLLSPSAAPCGVESFARRTARHWRQNGLNSRSLAVSGRLSDFEAIWRGLDDCGAIVVNFPMVAWKKALFTPLLAYLMALLRGRRTIMILHEWNDLDWRRRITLGAYALLAHAIIFSSPMVRGQYSRSPVARLRRSELLVTPIPANLDRVRAPAASATALHLRKLREGGKFILAHFGSIYPKKQSDFVLDVIAELKNSGVDVIGLFVGDFVKGCDDSETRFREKVIALDLEQEVLVTGYINRDEDVFSLFEEADCFVYRFADGLSSRRSSILASLQSGKPVIVNRPDQTDEFAHHRIFRTLLASGGLQLVSRHADAKEYAAAVTHASEASHPVDTTLFQQTWRDVVDVIAAAADPGFIAATPVAKQQH